MNLTFRVVTSILFTITFAKPGINNQTLPVCRGPRHIRMEVRDFKPTLSWRSSKSFKQSFSNYKVQTCSSDCKNEPGNFRWDSQDCLYLGKQDKRYYCELQIPVDFKDQLRVCGCQGNKIKKSFQVKKSCSIYSEDLGNYIIRQSTFSSPNLTSVSNKSTSVDLNIEEPTKLFLCHYDKIEYHLFAKEITNKTNKDYCVSIPPNKAEEQKALLKKLTINQSDRSNRCDPKTHPTRDTLTFKNLKSNTSYCIFGYFNTLRRENNMEDSEIGFIKVTTAQDLPTSNQLYLIPVILISFLFLATITVFLIKPGKRYLQYITHKDEILKKIFDDKNEFDKLEPLPPAQETVDVFEQIGDSTRNRESFRISTINDYSSDPKYLTQIKNSDSGDEEPSATINSFLLSVGEIDKNRNTTSTSTGTPEVWSTGSPFISYLDKNGNVVPEENVEFCDNHNYSSNGISECRSQLLNERSESESCDEVTNYIKKQSAYKNFSEGLSTSNLEQNIKDGPTDGYWDKSGNIIPEASDFILNRENQQASSRSERETLEDKIKDEELTSSTTEENILIIGPSHNTLLKNPEVALWRNSAIDCDVNKQKTNPFQNKYVHRTSHLSESSGIPEDSSETEEENNLKNHHDSKLNEDLNTCILSNYQTSDSFGHAIHKQSQESNNNSYWIKTKEV